MKDQKANIVQVDSVEEADKLMSNGWSLIDNGHVIVDNKAQFFFILKRGRISFAELGKAMSEKDGKNEPLNPEQ